MSRTLLYILSYDTLQRRLVPFINTKHYYEQAFHGKSIEGAVVTRLCLYRGESPSSGIVARLS